MIEISGTSVRLMMVTFVALVVSVTTQNWDTSAPVPEVDGTMTSGGMGLTTRSTPSKSRMCPPLADTMATPLAASMQEPPPTAMITSAPVWTYSQ